MQPEPLEGIADADARLGRPVPLPTAPLPLARWVQVTEVVQGGVEIAWNLDDTRPCCPGRLALYAGRVAAPDRDLAPGSARGRYAHAFAPLDDADVSLRPVHELAWEDDGLHLRLTGQGPWSLDELIAIADSI